MFEVCATDKKTGKIIVVGYSSDADGKDIIRQFQHNPNLERFHTRGLAYDTIDKMNAPKGRKR